MFRKMRDCKCVFIEAGLWIGSADNDDYSIVYIDCFSNVLPDELALNDAIRVKNKRTI